MEEKKWNKPEYQQMVSGKVKGDDLIVNFQDGSTVSIKRDSILPKNAQNPFWEEIKFFPYEIIIPTQLGEIEVPWTTVRIIGDTKFASHWAEQAEEQAKDIGRRIRDLRKSRNLTGKEVAERAGISPQSLSRIEKGYHDVVFTTLRKILAAMGCTLQDLANVQSTPPSLNQMIKRLEVVGIKKDWLLKRIIPQDFMSSPSNDTKYDLIYEAAKNVARVFGWKPEQIISMEDTLYLDTSIVQSAKFKMKSRAQEKQVSAYALYAHYLALLVLKATEHLQTKPIPDNPNEIKKEIASHYGPFTLENLITYVWDHGIPVIPLSDPGNFHGACWSVSGRPVVVLKQITKYQARWLYDLAHEIGHIVKHLQNRIETSIIEVEEVSPFDDSTGEEVANEFAAELLFPEDIDTLAEVSVNQAKNKVENLKSAVIQVAVNEHVPVDLLANYLAWRLSISNGINWWGTANNLQITDPVPLSIAKQILLHHIKPGTLSSEDYNLIIRAIDNEE